MFCPNYKNKEVFDGFNEMIEAFGGRPMTEEEFRSGELRMQRTGLDYSAMEAAYVVYDLNGGNFLDLAPNGEPSLLFLTLLSRNNGDRTSAIVLKANVYSKKYREKYGDWVSRVLMSKDEKEQIDLIFDRVPELSEIGTKQDYYDYINSIFPKSAEHSVYWHGSNSDFSKGFDSAERGEGSGAPETKKRNDFYLAKQAWSVLQYVDGINRNSIDRNGFSHWNRLWWEFKEIMSNGRRENNDWKDLVINEQNVRLAIPNKRGIFNRDKGGGNGKWLSERKADYGYENKSDKEFFEEILGVKWGTDTFNTWTQRNAEIFKYLQKDSKGIYPVVINTVNPIKETGLNTYYEEERGLMTQADENGNDAILSYNADNEFNSDVAVILNNPKDNVHFLGTKLDIEQFSEFVKSKSQKLDVNGEPILKDTSKLTLNINTAPLERADISIFGEDSVKLLNGESVSSQNLLNVFLENGTISQFDTIADLLLKHDIPVKISKKLGLAVLSKTITDKNGGSIILINPDLIGLVSNRYLATSLEHEIVHAVTVDAINNPDTPEKSRFKNLNHKLWSILDKNYPKDSNSRYNIDNGLYALSNEKEFAAVFITDQDARNTFYLIAREIDAKRKGSVLQTFKNLINSISRLFVNKNIFNTTEELLNKYQLLFVDYLNNKKPIVEGNIIPKSKLMEVYKSIDNNMVDNECTIDAMDIINKDLFALEQNNIKLFGREWSLKKNKFSIHSYDDIVNALLIRINAIKSSNLSAKDKTQFINTTRSLMEMFASDLVAKYTAITSTLRQVIPLLLNDLLKLLEIQENGDIISSEDYMFQMHSNIGLYKLIASILNEILNKDGEAKSLIDQYNEGVPEKDRISKVEIDELISDIASLNARADVAAKILNSFRNQIAFNKLEEVGKLANASSMQEWLGNVQSQTPVFDDDISMIWAKIGSMDSLEHEALRALSNIINVALDKAEEKSIAKNADLVVLQKNLKFGESQLDLYEKDERGRTTGWLLRDRNFGKMYKEYDEILILINKSISKLFGVKISNDSRVAPNSEETISINEFINHIKDINFDSQLLKDLRKLRDDNHVIEISARQAWNKMKNYWLYEHVDRKYNKKYYEAWENVSQLAKESLDRINGEIQSIQSQPGVIDEKGNRHFEVLSDKDWKLLQRLFINKKLLYSEYDIFGNKKTGIDLQIAKELQQLRKDLYGDKNTEIQKDKNSWLRAREVIIEQCGGREAYEKWMRGDLNSGFNSTVLKKWDSRNSRRIFKLDPVDKKPIVFKKIEEAMRGIKIDYGKEYEDLKELAKELLKPYWDLTGEVNAIELPDTVKNLLIEIYNKQQAIREQVISNNIKVRELNAKYREVFQSYIKYEDTEFFKAIKADLVRLATDEDDIFDQSYYDALLEDYGYFVFDQFNPFDDEFRPWRWLLRMEAINPEYMDYEPGDGWLEKVDNEDLFNKEFDESYNTAFVPKKKYYDNSSAFHILEEFNADGSKNESYSPTLRALYDGVQSTIAEANRMQTNRQYADDYLLPQMTGSFWKRERHQPWNKKWNIFIQWIKEHVGIGGEIQANDYDEVGSDLALDEQDEEGNVKISKHINTSGRYPDERSFNVIPQYYTRRLKDPSLLSADLVNIVGNYYRMSAAYEQRLKVRDDCETIVDFLRERRYIGGMLNKHQISGQDSNIYKTAQTFLEMNLYDIKRSRGVWNLGFTKLQWSKTANLWKRYTTAKNLGLNPKVAAVGFMTSMYSHLINSLTGQKYGVRDSARSFLNVLAHVSRNWMGAKIIGNPVSKDKMLLLAEEFNISNQARRKIEGTNRNPIIQSIYKHSTFGMLANVDYLTKTLIMMSVLYSYRLVDGELVTLDDIKMSRYLYTEEEYKKIIDKFKKADKLYNKISVKNGKLYIEDKLYAKAWEDKKFVIKNRAQKYSEAADGMATDLQKAAITQSWIGCFILIHRQYLPLILQERFGKRVYDYDMQLYKNGLFRMLFKFVNEVMQNSLASGMLSGVGVGYIFGGVLGSIAGILYSIYARKKGQINVKNGAQKKTTTLIFNEYFRDFENEKSNANSQMNRYAAKLIFFETAIYHILIVPIVTAICNLADEDDDKMLQMLAHWARGFQWESYTPYRTDDLMNNIKTPTAGTSVLDAIEETAKNWSKGITNTIFPLQNILFDPSQNWFDGDNADILFGKQIKKGAYKKYRPIERSAIKLLPFHNLFEQVKDAKSKRKYLENQVMKIRKD